jgi:hypothetical protein
VVRAKWKSSVYDHYEISLDRNTSNKSLIFIFTCIVDPERHKPHRRARQKTSSGTHDLQMGHDQCNKRRGVVQVATQSAAATKAENRYSESAHRALIVLWCAKYHRPLNMVLDEEYKQEVELLRPGTKLPHPTTLARDIHHVYVDGSKIVRAYFLVCTTFPDSSNAGP